MANTYTDLLKLRMPALGDIGWDDEVNDNVKIAEFVLGAILKSNVVISGLAPSDGGGLDIDYAAGTVVVAGAEYAISSGSKTCTSGVKNWLFVDDTGTVQISTDPPVDNYVALALIDAAGASIDRIADARNFAEGALTIGVDYSPNYYDPDTGQTGAINQHLAGIDNRLSFTDSLKNKIINPDFSIWQRATSQTTSGYGSDDRWDNANIGTTKTHSQQAFTMGQTEVPNNPKYFSRTVVTSSAGTSNYCLKEQKIESVMTLAGKSAILTFWAKADSSKNISIELVQYFGTGGSPSATVVGIGTATTNLTSNWQKFIVNFDIPSISGKTLGSDGNDFLGLVFWFDAGSTYDSRSNSLGQQSGTFDLAQVDLKEGSISTEFESRFLPLEEFLCFRYYWQGSAIGGGFNAFYTANTATSTLTGALVVFPVQMRVYPIVNYSGATFQSCTHGNLIARQGGLAHQVQATAVGVIRVYGATYTADAEL